MKKHSGQVPAAFVLRSGAVVPYRRGPEEMQGLLEELKSAIIKDSLARAGVGADTSSMVLAVGREMIAEVTHLVDRMPPVIARGIFIKLLYDVALQRLQADIDAYQRRPPTM